MRLNYFPLRRNYHLIKKDHLHDDQIHDDQTHTRVQLHTEVETRLVIQIKDESIGVTQHSNQLSS